jgi:hypothetical protein
MSNVARLWAAAAGVVMALASAPVALMTIASPAVSRADVCADAGGRHVDVAGCTDPGAAVYVAPPPADVAPPPAEVPPPPPPPAPDVTACADVGGRHVNVAGCN